MYHGFNFFFNFYLMKELFIIILLTCILSLIIQYFDNLNRKICTELYILGNNKKYTIVDNIVPITFCNQLIKSGEEYAEKFLWTKRRHANYPTVDNQVTESWSEYATLVTMIKEKISPEISKMYKIDKNSIGINELFLVKYDISGQRFLKNHVDGSEFSFVLQLNDEFEGGGTRFSYNDELVRLKAGSCLIFSGQNEHKGEMITSGTRYILAGFLHYYAKDYCENS